MSNFQFERKDNFPPIIKNLIIINALVWVAQYTLDKQYAITEKIGLWPTQSPHFHPYQIVTHFFAHSPDMIWHILFNMFMLWMFGKIMENLWGGQRFLFFYLACGIGAGLSHLAVEYFQYQAVINQAEALQAMGNSAAAQALLNVPVVAIGASGAVMGVMVAFAFTFPNTPLYIWFIPIPIKAKWVIGGYVVLDLVFGISNFSGDDIAHFAHVGGAVTGFIILMFWKKKDRNNFY